MADPMSYYDVERAYFAEADRSRKSADEIFWAELKRYPAIVEVTASYDGSGDDGSIEEPEFRTAADLAAAVDERSGRPTTAVDDRMKVAADQYLYAILESASPGWEINEGSYGTITITVLGHKVAVDHNERYEDSHYSRIEL